MPNDALDPGPDGTYPYWPRTAEGEWDEVRMPTGEHYQRRKSDGKVFRVDLTPRQTDGTPIVPPDLDPPD
jgi:hypothetical protein